MEAGRGGDAGELPSVTRVQGWRPISQRRRLRCRMARRSRKPGIAPGPPDPSCPREGDVARLSSHTQLVPSPSAQEGVLPSSPGPQVGGGSFSGIQKICVQPKAHLLVSRGLSHPGRSHQNSCFLRGDSGSRKEKN